MAVLIKLHTRLTESLERLAMWPWKKKKDEQQTADDFSSLGPETPGIGSPGSSMQLYIYRVRMGTGMEDVLSYVPPAVLVEEDGLDPIGIIGGYRSNISNLEEPQAVNPAELNPENFGRNRVFFDHLQTLVATSGAESPEMKAAANERWTGHLYVIDRRTLDPNGDVPPEDIVGAFEIENGQISAERYQPNPGYWILSERGIFNLPPVEPLLLPAYRARQKTPPGGPTGMEWRGPNPH